MQFFLKYIISSLFPRNLTCILCDRELFNKTEGNLCNICLGSIQFISASVCKACGRSIPSSNTYGICQNCILLNRNFDIGISVLKYDEYTKKIFFDFKYYKKKYIGHTMAVFLRKKLLELDIDIDCFIPVPLHSKKLKKRGFNQALIICNFLSDLTFIKTVDCLVRLKDTRPLNGLSNIERQKLLHNSFKVKKSYDLKNKVVVLVDDIFTTGATINECSRVLKESGVSYIISGCFGIGE